MCGRGIRCEGSEMGRRSHYDFVIPTKNAGIEHLKGYTE